MPSRLPGSLDELTPEWLTGALRAAGLDAARVRARRVEPIAAGSGFLGQLARLHLDYERPVAAAPATLIAKLPTLDPGGREIGRLFRFYEREVRFYRELGGRFEMRIPRCYHAAMEGDDFLLLLEDLGGLRPGDDVAGCSAAEAEAAVAAIARLQAAWWQGPRVDALDWMPMVNAPVHQMAETAYQAVLPAFLESFGDRLSPRLRRLSEDLATRIVAVLDASVEPPRTLLHGDYRLDNLFFGGGEVAAVDWQIACRGRGAFDLGYFLSGSVDTALRRAEEQRLLRLWHETVTDGEPGRYAFEQALIDYRRAVLYCHVYSVVAIGSLDPTNARGVAYFDRALARRCAAIEDLDAGDLLPR